MYPAGSTPSRGIIPGTLPQTQLKSRKNAGAERRTVQMDEQPERGAEEHEMSKRQRRSAKKKKKKSATIRAESKPDRPVSPSPPSLSLSTSSAPIPIVSVSTTALTSKKKVGPATPGGSSLQRSGLAVSHHASSAPPKLSRDIESAADSTLPVSSPAAIQKSKRTRQSLAPSHSSQAKISAQLPTTSLIPHDVSIGRELSREITSNVDLPLGTPLLDDNRIQKKARRETDLGQVTAQVTAPRPSAPSSSLPHVALETDAIVQQVIQAMLKRHNPQTSSPQSKLEKVRMSASPAAHTGREKAKVTKSRNAKMPVVAPSESREISTSVEKGSNTLSATEVFPTTPKKEPLVMSEPWLLYNKPAEPEGTSAYSSSSIITPAKSFSVDGMAATTATTKNSLSVSKTR